MLPSAEQQNSNIVSEISNKNKSLDRVSSSPTSSPSSSASSSSLPTSRTLNKPQPIMEEVWKDINLASLHHHHHHQNPHDLRLRGHQTQHPSSIFQDFLNRPQNQEPPTSLSMGSNSNGDTSTVTALYGSPLQPPATVLSLSSRAGFEFLDNPDSNLQNHPHLATNVSSLATPFEALASAGRFGCYGKKRGQDSDGSSSDRRNKRMIKNRESAARSRARKQAYTNELELEVAHLQAENARLKREQEQQRMAAVSQLPKKSTLQRTSTAPF